MLQFELVRQALTLQDYVSRAPDVNRLPADFGVGLAAKDQQLVAAELSTRDWRKVLLLTTYLVTAKSRAENGRLTRAYRAFIAQDRSFGRAVKDGVDALAPLTGTELSDVERVVAGG